MVVCRCTIYRISAHYTVIHKFDPCTAHQFYQWLSSEAFGSRPCFAHEMGCFRACGLTGLALSATRSGRLCRHVLALLARDRQQHFALPLDEAVVASCGLCRLGAARPSVMMRAGRSCLAGSDTQPPEGSPQQPGQARKAYSAAEVFDFPPDDA